MNLEVLYWPKWLELSLVGSFMSTLYWAQPITFAQSAWFQWAESQTDYQQWKPRLFFTHVIAFYSPYKGST